MKIVTPKNRKSGILRIDRLISWFNHLDHEPREIILAVIVGLLGGFGVYLLRQAIYAVYLVMIALPLYFAQHFIAPYLHLTVNSSFILVVILFSTTLGGVILGILNKIFPPEKGEHGVAQVINAVENNQGKLRYRYPVLGLIKSAITIGSGGAVGREGPVVQIGGGSGSAVGQFFKVSPEERKTLIIAGVAGGISATFNAPIGGLMFSFELFRRGDKSPRLLPLLVSSVVGSTVIIFLIGKAPFLDFTKYANYDWNPSNFIYFVIMGIALGIISVIWILGFHIISKYYEEFKIPKLIKPATGGFLLGIIYIFVLYFNILNQSNGIQIQLPVWIEVPAGSSFPTYFGSAKEAMNSALSSGLIFLALAALVIFVVALVGNAITLGSGNSGGQLAPTLLMGLMLGVIFAQFFNYLNTIGIGIFDTNAGLVEVLAMAAFFAGSTRLPMTSIILVAEIVDDQSITIPLMFTVAAAWFVSRLIIKDDMFSLALKEKGIISDFETPSDYLLDLPVSKVMMTNVDTVSPKDRIEQVLTLIETSNHNGFPVVENDELVGVITTHDLIRAVHSGKNINELIVQNIFELHVISVVPGCPVVTALEIMDSRRISRLPIIESYSNHKLVGMVTRADLNKATLQYGLTAKHNKFEDQLFETDFLVAYEKKIGENNSEKED